MIRPIVFAAGLGKRMGAIKALIPIDGVPALAVVLRTIQEAGLDSPLVVLGNDAAAIRSRVDLHACQVIVNPHPDHGLSGSMRVALRALDETDTGMLVFHVDMPYIATSTVSEVVKAATRGARLAAPYHESVRGFPVYFHCSAFGALSDSLQGDRGGRQFLIQHEETLMRVHVIDPGCVFDIDRPSDLTAWKGVRQCATTE